MEDIPLREALDDEDDIEDDDGDVVPDNSDNNNSGTLEESAEVSMNQSH